MWFFKGWATRPPGPKTIYDQPQPGLEFFHRIPMIAGVLGKMILADLDFTTFATVLHL